MDARTESEVLEAVRRLLRESGGTSIFVAHRLASIQDADKIIVLKDGRIAEEGTHNELLRNGVIYRELWRVQQNRTDELHGRAADAKDSTR